MQEYTFRPPSRPGSVHANLIIIIIIIIIIVKVKAFGVVICCCWPQLAGLRGRSLVAPWQPPWMTTFQDFEARLNELRRTNSCWEWNDTVPWLHTTRRTAVTQVSNLLLKCRSGELPFHCTLLRLSKAVGSWCSKCCKMALPSPTHLSHLRDRESQVLTSSLCECFRSPSCPLAERRNTIKQCFWIKTPSPDKKVQTVEGNGDKSHAAVFIIPLSTVPLSSLCQANLQLPPLLFGHYQPCVFTSCD